MSQANKRGFKPGANMPRDDYDPMEQGMSESGNHAVGHPGNDNPTSNHQQHGRQPARSEQSVRQGNLGRSYYDSKQAASAAASQSTHRYNTTGARGDSNSGNSGKLR